MVMPMFNPFADGSAGMNPQASINFLNNFNPFGRMPTPIMNQPPPPLLPPINLTPLATPDLLGFTPRPGAIFDGMPQQGINFSQFTSPMAFQQPPLQPQPFMASGDRSAGFPQTFGFSGNGVPMALPQQAFNFQPQPAAFPQQAFSFPTQPAAFPQQGSSVPTQPGSFTPTAQSFDSGQSGMFDQLFQGLGMMFNALQGFFNTG